MYKKLYTDKEYVEMSDIANKAGQMLYRWQYVITEEIPQTDDLGQEQPPEIVTTNYETLKIAPIGYYVCVSDNITNGTINSNYESDIQAAIEARIQSLSLTAADVERAILADKGLTFELLIREFEDNPMIDINALKVELDANNFYRNHPMINQLGALLGYTKEQLDNLFLYKSFRISEQEE